MNIPTTELLLRVNGIQAAFGKGIAAQSEQATKRITDNLS